MKYIIIPILKFIWTILMLFIFCPYIVASQLLLALWEWKLDFEWEVDDRTSCLISALFKRNPNSNYNTYHFKTVFHYILGIQKI